MREARDREKELRDASWAGRRGQAERAALAEMTTAVQGRNAADYAARCEHAPLTVRHCFLATRLQARVELVGRCVSTGFVVQICLQKKAAVPPPEMNFTSASIL